MGIYSMGIVVELDNRFNRYCILTLRYLYIQAVIYTYKVTVKIMPCRFFHKG